MNEAPTCRFTYTGTCWWRHRHLRIDLMLTPAIQNNRTSDCCERCPFRLRLWLIQTDFMSPEIHAPFHHLWLADFGLVEKGVLCAIMTITVGVDSGSLWGIPGLFLLILYHIASKNKKRGKSQEHQKAWELKIGALSLASLRNCIDFKRGWRPLEF